MTTIKEKESLITQEYLKSIFNYDPDTGDFTNIVDRNYNSMAGDLVGCINSKGYRVITMGSRNYRSHRLAWLYMEGVWPENQIDHINGARSDNRWENLREATCSQNRMNNLLNKNNKSGVSGVYYKNKWLARITVNYKSIRLECDGTLEGAIKVRREAEIEHYGEFRSRSERKKSEVMI